MQFSLLIVPRRARVLQCRKTRQKLVVNTTSAVSDFAKRASVSCKLSNLIYLDHSIEIPAFFLVLSIEIMHERHALQTFAVGMQSSRVQSRHAFRFRLRQNY